ncbi:response regulator [Thermodesulfobacteriota bacterium]
MLRSQNPGSIETALEEDLRTINGDPSQIEQILFNLALNAKDAMPEGGRLDFATENATIGEEYALGSPELIPGEYVLLKISDTGQGMDKDVSDRIYEPFFTTKQVGKGSGLGLSTVFGIVKGHGGHITCQSKAGVGTTFRVYFPAVESDLSKALDDPVEIPSGGTETILLVDDEEPVRVVGREMLEMAGYTVLTVAGGREALSVYREYKDSIALVILDLIMPDMGGRKCLEKLREMDPHVRVLVASGYAAEGPARDALNGGAAGFISKPFDMKQILVALRKSLD